MNFYFAYGSNMDQDQMYERCPNAVLLGRAMLSEYRLAFTIFSPKRLCGCADIVPSMGDTVHGLLYKLTDIEMETLDTFEGHPIHYRRVPVRVNSQGKEVEAVSYEVVEKQDAMHPSVHYLSLLQSAAARFNFPDEYQAVLRNTKTI